VPCLRNGEQEEDSMRTHFPRIASIAAAMVLAGGMAASPLGAAAALADGSVSISGNLVGAAGNLGGIQVWGCTTDWSFCSDTIATDDAGAFALTGLQPGQYIIEVDAGPNYIWGWYVGPGLTQDFGSATPVDVTNGNATLTDIQLDVALKISGSLTGAAGGLSSLQVLACSDQTGCTAGTVDDGGNYLIPGLTPDTYRLRVVEPLGMIGIDPHSPYVFGYYNGSGLSPLSTDAKPIVVSDTDVTLPVFDVPVGAVLSGSVTGSAGNLGNLFVEACSLKYGPCLDTSTDDNGSFYFSGLWPDNYRLDIEDLNNHTYVGGYYTPSGLVQNDSTWTAIKVGAKGRVLPAIGLETASTIQGTVTGGLGNLGYVLVQACPTVGPCVESQTDSSGNFAVAGLAAGSYTLNFDDWSGTYAAGYYSDSGLTVPTADLATQIAVPPSVSGLTVALTPGGDVAPWAPMDVTATAGNGSATVSWTPNWDGGSPITSYTVTGSDGSTCVSTTTTCTVTGLVNGSPVTFTVVATNAIGTGGWDTPSDPVTPVGPARNGPAKLAITASTHTSIAGGTVSVTVSALNKNGSINTGYSRTVYLTSTDLRAALPDDYYTFTAADAGTHTFTVSLAMAGAQSISVNDGTLTSRKWSVSVKPGQATNLAVVGPQSVTAGTAGHYMAMSFDAFGNIATTDTSLLSITSTDPSMSVSPASVALARGKHAFSATFKTAGVQSIQVFEAANPSLTASLDGIAVNPAKAASISITGLPASTTAGAAATVTATVHDRFGNVATGYVGTVHFASNDKTASMPADYTFTSADAGVHTFTLSLNSAGNRWVTIRDASKHSIGGRALTVVVASQP
jgi:hypothetical protein